MRRRNNFKRKAKSSPKTKRETPYNIPSQAEISKKKAELNKHLKKLDKDGYKVKTLTESQKMSIIRGAVRELWMYDPSKLAYLLLGVEPDIDEGTRRRFKIRCECCGKWFKTSDICIDHKVGEHSLKSIEDFDSFYDSIINVGFKDLQRLCTTCHEVKTAQERYNLSEEEARVFKKVTAWESEYVKADDQKKFLKAKGFTTEDVKNKENRRLSALEYFKSLE